MGYSDHVRGPLVVVEVEYAGVKPLEKKLYLFHVLIDHTVKR